MTMNESYNLSGSVCDEAGNQAVMLHMGYGEKQMNLHAEILNAGYVKANAQAVREQVSEFLTAAFERAAQKFAALPGAAEGA